MSTRTTTVWLSTASRTAATSWITTAASIRREADVGTTSNCGIGIACAVEDAGAAANGDTTLECGLGGTADDERATAAGWGLEGEGLAADGHRIPRALAPRRGLIARLRKTGAALQSTDGNDGTASDVELLLLLAVGVDGHLRRARANGIYQSTLDIAVAVGIDAVVASRAGIYIAAADSQVAGIAQTLGVVILR